MRMTPEQEAEIAAARESKQQTRRPTVAALEEVLFQPIDVLDHGFVRVIDYMGDDSAIVQAARVSYGKGTKKVTEDRGLIRYLMRHRHTTPFEMCEIKLHCKLPIFVARQWIRHRTASVNEYSARYSILDREFYVPAEADLGVQATSNRQGRGDTLSPERSATVLRMLREDDEVRDFGSSLPARLVRRFVPVTEELERARFFVRRSGTLYATPLFVALVMVELTDIVFAVDSIPAILAVTRDPFLVFTSNAFAILGLRSLYFAVAGLMALFRYLKYSLVLVLAFVGVKMLLIDIYHVPNLVSLAIIVTTLGAGSVASLWATRRDRIAAERGGSDQPG